MTSIQGSIPNPEFRSAEIAKVYSAWQQCLYWSEWLRHMERITLRISEGGALTNDHFDRIEEANLLLSEVMTQVSDQAKQLDLV